jgi:hypothetical protein
MLTPKYALLALVSLASAMSDQARLSGAIPIAFNGAARVVWLPADSGGDVRCGVDSPTTWSCEGLSSEARGVVALIGEGIVGVAGFGVAAVEPAIERWGRAVRVTPGNASPEELHDLTIAAFKPERPRIRLKSRRYQRIKDDDVHVSKLSETTFWISGGDVDADGYVLLEGPAIGSQRLATRRLLEGPPEEPVFLSAATAETLSGRVLDARGNTVDGADVDLWELLQPDERPSRLDDATPMLHRAAARTSSDGAFQFEGLDGGVLLITAFHPTQGLGRVWITQPRPTIDLELTTPTRATGRIIRRSLPVPGARVRFFPDADAFAASLDPLTAVAGEARTSDDGTFSLGLPPNHTGHVLADLDDGARARVAVPAGHTKGDIMLGDIAIPDGSHVTVQLLDGSGCGIALVGPLGALGMVIVRAVSTTPLYELDLPESGTWNVNAECGDRTYNVEPPLVVVQPDRATTIVDARVVRSPG